MRIFAGLFLSIIHLLCVSHPATAVDPDATGPDDSYYLVYDFSNDWLIFNQDEQTYIPYTRTLHENDPAVSLVIDLLKYRNYDLLIKTQAENHLFIDGALHKIILPDQWITLNTDSLLKANNSEDLLLTFFGHEKVSGRTVQIGHKKDSNFPLTFENLSSHINIKPKTTSYLLDIFILLLLLVVALNGMVLSIAPLFYRSFMNPLYFFKKDNRDEKTIYSNPFSTESFLMTLQLSLLMTPFGIFIIQHLSNMSNFDFFSGNIGQWSGLIIEFIEIFIVCLVIIYLKFFNIKLTSNLLGTEYTSNQHFTKTLQSSFHFYLLISITLLFCTLYTPDYLQETLQFLVYFTVFFYFIRFIFLYFVMNISGPFINLYLFSYLCIVEIIPLTIGIKYIL